jgi:uncharacterized protein
MPSTINIPQKFLDDVRVILKAHVPEYEVWAYGSRVTGGAWEASDLDLVVRHPENVDQICEKLLELRSAFSDSNLPINVDVMDWASIPQSFRDQILREHVVLQKVI